MAPGTSCGSSRSHDGPTLTLGFRNQWQYSAIPGWTGKTLDRLGIEPDLHETGGAKGAREALDARLDAGVPVIAAVDLQSIGTWGQPDAMSGYGGLVVVVFGRDADGSYLVDDRGRRPFRVSPAVMAAARGRIGSLQAPDRRAANDARTDPGRYGFGRRCAQVSKTRWITSAHRPTRSRSRPGASGRRLMTDSRNAKAWPRVFADGHRPVRLAVGASTRTSMARSGQPGGHLRELYADVSR